MSRHAASLSGMWEGASQPFAPKKPMTLWSDCQLSFHPNGKVEGRGSSQWKGETILFRLRGSFDPGTGKIELYKTHTGRFSNTVYYQGILDPDKRKLTGEYRAGTLTLEKADEGGQEEERKQPAGPAAKATTTAAAGAAAGAAARPGAGAAAGPTGGMYHLVDEEKIPLRRPVSSVSGTGVNGRLARHGEDTVSASASPVAPSSSTSSRSSTAPLSSSSSSSSSSDSSLSAVSGNGPSEATDVRRRTDCPALSANLTLPHSTNTAAAQPIGGGSKGTLPVTDLASAVALLNGRWLGQSVTKKTSEVTLWRDVMLRFTLSSQCGIVEGTGNSLWRKEVIPFRLSGTFDLHFFHVKLLKQHTGRYTNSLEYHLQLSLADRSMASAHGTVSLQHEDTLAAALATTQATASERSDGGPTTALGQGKTLLAFVHRKPCTGGPVSLHTSLAVPSSPSASPSLVPPSTRESTRTDRRQWNTAPARRPQPGAAPAVANQIGERPGSARQGANHHEQPVAKRTGDGGDERPGARPRQWNAAPALQRQSSAPLPLSHSPLSPSSSAFASATPYSFYDASAPPDPDDKGSDEQAPASSGTTTTNNSNNVAGRANREGAAVGNEAAVEDEQRDHAYPKHIDWNAPDKDVTRREGGDGRVSESKENKRDRDRESAEDRRGRRRNDIPTSPSRDPPRARVQTRRRARSGTSLSSSGEEDERERRGTGVGGVRGEEEGEGAASVYSALSIVGAGDKKQEGLEGARREGDSHSADVASEDGQEDEEDNAIVSQFPVFADAPTVGPPSVPDAPGSAQPNSPHPISPSTGTTGAPMPESSVAGTARVGKGDGERKGGGESGLDMNEVDKVNVSVLRPLSKIAPTATRPGEAKADTGASGAEEKKEAAAAAAAAAAAGSARLPRLRRVGTSREMNREKRRAGTGRESNREKYALFLGGMISDGRLSQKQQKALRSFRLQFLISDGDHELVLSRLNLTDAKLQSMMCKREEEDEEDVRSKDDCIICYSNQANCILLPCAHLHICMDCSKSLNECPVCRTKIQEAKRVFRNN